MSETKTIYAGNGKTVETQYGIFRAITINLTDLPKEHIFEYEGKKYIKLNVNDKKQTDQYGKNVAVTVNTWKPDKASSENAVEKNIGFQNPAIQKDDDLPF